MAIVSPSDRRVGEEERSVMAANRCQFCKVGTWVLRRTGMVFKKEVVVCDKCGRKKEDVDAVTQTAAPPAH